MTIQKQPVELIPPRGEEDWMLIESLYVELFPPDERRDFSLMKQYYNQKECFNVFVILYENRAVGFFTLWEFDRFFYGEHFAVNQSLANMGIGSKVLNLFDAICTKPFYLEVEPPTNEITTRRVGFYQRNGFVLIDRVYIQPPYSPERNAIELRLMVRGAERLELTFEEVEKTIHGEVYGKK